MSDCLNEDLVDRFVAQKLSAQELQQVKAHLETCAACRRRVQANQPTLATPGPAPGTPADAAGGTMPDASKFAGDEDLISKSLGALLENYQVLDRLPLGGQAEVYKAIHKPTKRKVALKILPSHRLGSARAKRAFEREVELVSKLTHPNIVRLYDSGIIHDQYYFSMEYIHGKPLDVFLASRSFDLHEKIRLFAKICAAVGCAHENAVIHSDLKPDNILVDNGGEPHILDFGLARVAGTLGSDEGAIPVTGQWAGTLPYMSPEQAEGPSDLMNVRSDVYSLGVMFYQLLTGRFPYEVSGGTAQIIRAIQLQKPIRPRQFISQFNADLETILLKCLAKDRSRRYGTAGELHEELQRWLEDKPIEAKYDNLLYLLRKAVSRYKLAASTILLLAVIVVSFACISFHLYLNARRAEQAAVTIAGQWKEQSKRLLALHTEAAFMDFLAAFQSGHLDRARMIASFVRNASKESRAMRFLLDPNSVSVKDESFRRAVAAKPNDPNSWFVDLTLGEDYLRRDQWQEAVQAYQRSDQALPGQGRLSILPCLVQARLYGLTRERSGTGVQMQTVPKSQSPTLKEDRHGQEKSSANAE